MSLIWIEVVLGFGVPVGWAVWQLVSLRREQARDRAEAALREAESRNPKPNSFTAEERS